MLSRTSTGRLSTSGSPGTPAARAAEPSSRLGGGKSVPEGVNKIAPKPKPSTSATSLSLSSPSGSFARPSQKLNPATVQPLGNKKHKTAFGAMYARGEIPCRLNHGSVKHKIAWTSPIEHIDITTLLPAFFSGLIETQHPYATIVQQGIRDLLSTHHHSLPAPLLPLLIPPLRAALSCRTTPTFSAALCALTQLAECVGEDLAPFVRVLVPPVAARVLDGLWRERCFEALGVVECQGGEKVGSVVRALCPTYSSAFHG